MTRMPVFPMRFALWLRRRAAGVLRALLPCALLLLLGASWLTTVADTKPKPMTAIFLVARSELPDPNFADSVVLVMNNLGPGPVGLIINRPTKIPVSELFRISSSSRHCTTGSTSADPSRSAPSGSCFALSSNPSMRSRPVTAST